MAKTVNQVEAMKAKLAQGKRGVRVSAVGTNDWLDEIIESITASTKDLNAHVDRHPDQKAELIPILQRQVDLAVRMVMMRGDVVGGQPPKGPVDSGGQSEDDGKMESRIVKLEVVSENTAKALEAIQRRLDDGFKESRADFRIMVGIQITTLLAILGVLAKAAKMF